jgi:hypothetical protein
MMMIGLYFVEVEASCDWLRFNLWQLLSRRCTFRFFIGDNFANTMILEAIFSPKAKSDSQRNQYSFSSDSFIEFLNGHCTFEFE